MAHGEWVDKHKFLTGLKDRITVVTKWECDFERERKEDDVKAFLEDFYKDGRPSER